MPWLIAGYIWLYLHRPFEIWTILAEVRIEYFYAVSMGIVWLLSPGKVWFGNGLHFAVGFFTFAIFACWVSTPYSPLYGEKVWDDQYKIGFLYFLLATSIRDEKTFRRILTCYFAVLFLYQFHSFVELLNGRYEFRMGIARMKGVDVTFGDPNTFAATILHAMPLLVPFWMTGTPKTKKFILAYLGFSLLCIMLTGSRRAFVGVGFLAFLLALGSKNRGRLLLGMALLAPIGFVALPESLQNRFLTLIDPSLGPSNAQTSANFRYLAWFDGLAMFNKYPLTGVGPGAFGRAAGHGMQAHNLYAQTIGEMGLLGVVGLTLTVVCFWWNARQVRKLYDAHPWWEKDFLYHTVRSVWVAVVLLLFMGIGGHNLYRYTWLWFGAFQLIALGLARRRAAEEAETVPAPLPQPEPTREVAVGYVT